MKNVKKVASKVAILDESKKVKKSKPTKAKKAKTPKVSATKAKKIPETKKPKVKVYNVSGKFKADAEGNVVKSSKNMSVEHVKKMENTGKPGFVVTVAVHSK